MKHLPDLTDEEEEYEQAKHEEFLQNCVTGSSKLKDALLKAFEKFEQEHGLEPGEAKTLLCDTGVRR